MHTIKIESISTYKYYIIEFYLYWSIIESSLNEITENLRNKLPSKLNLV